MKELLVKVAQAGVIGEAALYAVALIGAVLHYRAAARRRSAPPSLRDFVRHLFPRALLVSPWTRLDSFYYIVNKLSSALVFPSVAVMVVVAAGGVQAVLGRLFGTGLALPENAASLALFVLAGLLVRDFASFYIHLMQHRIPLLWEFHKVHHAPESLVPPTSQRLHPLDLLPGMMSEAVMLGGLVGCYGWLTHQELAGLVVCAVGLYSLFNILTFAPLRHSHIDLRFGRFERFLLSPAHHRLHHSVERRHWDKNFAALFPFWDRLFKTLHEPVPSDTYRLGLPDGASAGYATLPGCYLTPFHRIHGGLKTLGLRHMLRPGPLASARPPPVAVPLDG